jgi:hypothetical protein
MEIIVGFMEFSRFIVQILLQNPTKICFVAFKHLNESPTKDKLIIFEKKINFFMGVFRKKIYEIKFFDFYVFFYFK